MKFTDQYGLPLRQNYPATRPFILPPQDIRSVIDSTALSVFRMGVEYEAKIKERTANDPRYNFFCESDRYHAYFQHKLAEYNDIGEPTDYDENLRPDIPSSHKYSVSYPKGITAEKLDIMMLTAQFQAQYGPLFLFHLEKSNVMSNTEVFQLVDDERYAQMVLAYAHVVKPPISFKEDLRDSATDMTTVLEHCFHRLQWRCFSNLERKRLEDQRLQDIIETANLYGVTLPPQMQPDMPLLPPPGSQFAHPPPALPHPEEPEPKRPKFDKSALDERLMPSTVIEQTRSKHEEIERLERMIVKELEIEQPSCRESLFIQGHRLRLMIKEIMHETERLVETFEDTSKGIECEIAPLGAETNVFSLFCDRLQKIHEYHREHRSGNRLVGASEDDEALSKEGFGRYLDLHEPIITFTGEEGFGRYLDLHDMYNKYINSEFGEIVQYCAYLDVFSQPEKIPRLLSSQYKRYVEALLGYLIDFFERTEPLQDLDIIFSKVEADFEEQYADGKVEGWENYGQENEAKEIGKEIEQTEAKVKKLCNLLDETIKRTKQDVGKKLMGKDIRDVDGKPPMGWDGEPVPYSIYKFHDLGQEFKCDICGKFSFWGRTTFERHFKELRYRHRISIRKAHARKLSNIKVSC